ncbi:MAG: peptidoglycan-binding protein [Phormidesmis sp.]
MEKIQKRLTENGYSLSIDGDFGKTTENILKQFQADAGLSNIDGVFDPATYDALFTNRATANHRVLAHV